MTDLRKSLADAWEEFEVAAKPSYFDGDTEFYSIESMVDAAYDVKAIAEAALAAMPDAVDATAIRDAALDEAAHLMPRYFGVWSSTGVHIGVWDDGATAAKVLGEYPGGVMRDLVDMNAILALRTQPAPTACRKCGGTMADGQAIAQTFVGGLPDFEGDKHSSTFSAGGPGKLEPCRKCQDCGWSVTAAAPAPAPTVARPCCAP